MNDGFLNEETLRTYINERSFSDYNENIKSFLRFLFDEEFEVNLPFFASKIAGRAKPDLCISHNGIKKYVSLKKGSGNSVHQEGIEVFFPFFRDLFGDEALDKLKLFHYGDDTLDDSGEIRYDAAGCKLRYAKQIADLNELINTRERLEVFLNRFLFVGNVKSASVDVIYHGTINNGLWASREEIFDYMLDNKFDMNAIHFGPLTYQVWGRNEKRTAVHPERRYVMQIKWGSAAKDLTKITQKRR